MRLCCVHFQFQPAVAASKLIPWVLKLGALKVCKRVTSIGGGTGGQHMPRPPHFYFWGAWLPTFQFCLVGLSNTIGVGSIVEPGFPLLNFA